MTNLSTFIDAYGEIDAQIKSLEAKKQELRTALLELGPGAYVGSNHELRISVAERTTVDWKTVAAKLRPSHQLVAAHSKTTEVTTLKASVCLQAAA